MYRSILRWRDWVSGRRTVGTFGTAGPLAGSYVTGSWPSKIEKLVVGVDMVVLDVQSLMFAVCCRYWMSKLGSLKTRAHIFYRTSNISCDSFRPHFKRLVLGQFAIAPID